MRAPESAKQDPCDPLCAAPAPLAEVCHPSRIRRLSWRAVYGATERAHCQRLPAVAIACARSSRTAHRQTGVPGVFPIANSRSVIKTVRLPAVPIASARPR